MPIQVAGTNLSDSDIISIAMQPDGSCLVVHSGGAAQQPDFKSALGFAGELANAEKKAVLILPQSVPGIRRMGIGGQPGGQQGDKLPFLIPGTG